MNRIAVSGLCFWTLEAIFDAMEHVDKTETVYVSIDGGNVIEAVVIEAVVIEAAPEYLDEILTIHASCHFPETNSWETGSFPSYRSAVFCFDDETMEIVRRHKENGTLKEGTRIILTSDNDIRKAPSGDQSYYCKKPHDIYSLSQIAPKLDRLKSRFPSFFGSDKHDERDIPDGGVRLVG